MKIGEKQVGTNEGRKVLAHAENEALDRIKQLYQIEDARNKVGKRGVTGPGHYVCSEKHNEEGEVSIYEEPRGKDLCSNGDFVFRNFKAHQF